MVSVRATSIAADARRESGLSRFTALVLASVSPAELDRETAIEMAAENQRRRAGQDLRVERHVELAVDQHAFRLARRVDRAHGHARIVFPHSAAMSRL